MSPQIKITYLIKHAREKAGLSQAELCKLLNNQIGNKDKPYIIYKIKEARIKTGISQNELYLKTGITSIPKYEQLNVKSISLRNLIILSRALNVPVTSLYIRNDSVSTIRKIVPSVISRIENGKVRNIGIELIDRVAVALGCDIEELCENSDMRCGLKQ